MRSGRRGRRRTGGPPAGRSACATTASPEPHGAGDDAAGLRPAAGCCTAPRSLARARLHPGRRDRPRTRVDRAAVVTADRPGHRRVLRAGDAATETAHPYDRWSSPHGARPLMPPSGPGRRRRGRLPERCVALGPAEHRRPGSPDRCRGCPGRWSLGGGAARRVPASLAARPRPGRAPVGPPAGPAAGGDRRRHAAARTWSGLGITGRGDDRGAPTGGARAPVGDGTVVHADTGGRSAPEPLPDTALARQAGPARSARDRGRRSTADQ